MAEEKKKIKKNLTVRQKKKRRTLILTITALVLVVALAVAMRFIFPDDGIEEAELGESFKIIKMDAKDVTKYEIHNAFGDLSFYYDADDDTWYNSNDADFPAEQSILSQLAKRIEGLTSTSRIEKTDERLEEYGLNDSEIIVSIFDKRNRKETFYLGKYNSIKGQYYLYNTEKDYIYLVDATFQSIFEADEYSYATVDDFPYLSSDSFVSVSKTTGDNEYYLEYLEEGLPDNMMDNMTWYFGKPFSTMHACIESNSKTLFEDFAALNFYKLADYYAVGDELKDYGLDDPEKLNFFYLTESGKDDEGNTTYNSNIMELYVGSLESSGLYYYVSYRIITNNMIAEDNKKVSLMEKQDLDWLLNLDPFDYIYTNIFYAMLSDIETLEINDKDDQYKFVIECDTTQDKIASSNGKEMYPNSAYTYYYNDKAIADSDGFRNAYMHLLSLKGLEILSPDRVIDGEAEISWTIHQNAVLDTIQVELIPFNASSYEVRVNGIVDYLVSKQEALDAIACFETLVGEMD